MSRVKFYHPHFSINIFSTSKLESLLSLGVIWVLTGTVLFPHLVIGSIGLGLDDACALLLSIVFLYILLLKPKNFLFKGNLMLITMLWAFLLVTGIVFSIFGGLFHINQFRVPTEMWQYVKRMLFFYSTCYVSYRCLVSPANFYRCLIYVLLIAFIVGIFQILPWSIGDQLSSLYARSEAQLLNTEKSFTYLRNYGIAGGATAWGGFAMFGVAVSLGMLLATRKEQGEKRFHRFQLWSVLVLALINALVSGSRVALAAILAVYLVSVLIGIFLSRHKLRFFLQYVGVSILLGIGFGYALWEKLFFIVFRYEDLIDKLGGERVNQTEVALSLLKNGQDWLLGVGNVTQRTLATSFGTEVEPVYLLVNYGIMGVALRYCLLLVIFIFALRQLNRSVKVERGFAIASVLALIGYSVFSLGYFFYQELYVGMLPWLLFGWIVGAYCRYNSRVLVPTTIQH